jgi:hypothetical protein
MLDFEDRVAKLTFALHTADCRCGCQTTQLIDPMFLCDDTFRPVGQTPASLRSK